jgi:hypothetical protein
MTAREDGPVTSALVRTALHLCPTDLPSPKKWEWMANHINTNLATPGAGAAGQGEKLRDVSRHARRCANQCRDEGHHGIAEGFDEISRMIDSAGNAHGERVAILDGTNYPASMRLDVDNMRMRLQTPQPAADAGDGADMQAVLSEAERVAKNLRKNGHYLAANIIRILAEEIASRPAATAQVPDDAMVRDLSEVLSAFDKAASIAQRCAGNVDAIEERGGEEADDPMERIHYILHNAYFAWRRTYGRQPIAAAPAAPKGGVVDEDAILEIVGKYVGKTSGIYRYIHDDLKKLATTPTGQGEG